MSFTASFPGECSENGDRIRPGDLIERTDDGYRHVRCPDDPDLTAGAACPRCHLIHAGECF